MVTDQERAIIEPRRGKREKELPSRAIVAFTPDDLELMRHHAPQLRQRPQRMALSSLWVADSQERAFAVAGPMLGAPQTILVLEKLIALGATEIIAAGWCGALQTHVRVGDLVIPTGAFSEEGTSVHYPVADPSAGPSRDLFQSLREVLTRRGATVHEGMVWSTDAPYRETVGKVVRYQKAGALAVEMEISALFTVAAFRSVRIAALLTVSDELSSLAWVHGFRDPGFRQAREIMVASIMEVVSRE